MKGLFKTLVSIGVLLGVANAFHACKSPGKVQSPVADTVVIQKSTGVESLDQFLSDFESAVLAHNANQVLNFLDKDYKKEQYEKQMKYNTDSFLNAFFSSNQMVQGKYTIGFKNISKITRSESKVLAGTYTIYSVTYTVWAGNVSQSLMISVFTRLDKGLVKHSIYGPVS